MAKKTVVVGLSGGVDSSFAAWLLLQQGYAVRGLFMQNWEEDSPYCSIKEDVQDAIAVADILGIDIDIVNFSEQYKSRVFQHFIDEYAAGRTPNPDIFCNSEIKFSVFLEHAKTLGAEAIATGHYARIEEARSRYGLKKGRDATKDQSYFLYRLKQTQLSQALMPLGGLLKSYVRQAAAEIRLPTAFKKDSTGICFIGKRPFRQFLSRYLTNCPGPIQTPDGRCLGEHVGLMHYTIGQRQGIGIGGAGAPWFVAAKHLAHNVLIVVQGHDHPMLYTTEVSAHRLSWTSHPPEEGESLTAKTRYRQADARCAVSGLEEDQLKLRFESSQWAVTAGQSVVCYRGEACIGGGIIQ